MSSSSAASQPGPMSTLDPEEVVRLFCPECSGKLNLRRKHVGIAGACVHCSIPVMAVDEGGVVKLVDTRAAKTAATAENPGSKPAGEPETVASIPSTAPSTPPPLTQPEVAPTKPLVEMAPSTEMSPPATPPAQAVTAPVEVATPVAPSTSPKSPELAAASGSSWGFPDRDTPPVQEVSSAPADASEPKVEAVEEPATQPEPTAESNPESKASSFDFSSLPEGSPPPWDDILSQTESNPKSEVAADPVDTTMEMPAPAEIQKPEDEVSMSPPEEISEAPVPVDDLASPALEPVEEVPVEKEDPFEFDALPEKSALFSSNKEDTGVHSGWGTKVPSQNHASISPFSTGSATPDASNRDAPGFAEALFKEKPSSSDSSATRAASSGEQKSPFGETSGSDSGAAAPSPFAQIGAPPSSDEPVVLDGDGRPMAPMADEEKDAFAREMMQLGDYHKRSPWVKRIRRFFITIAVLVGSAYAAYLFMPREVVKDYKNKALAFLEPGSVLLDFLPVEIVDDPEGEEGDKMVKGKAIDGLNQLTDQMDGYLNQADQNLRDSGAVVEEREKLEHMDQPNMPKLPFNVDLDKLQSQVNESAESAQEELEKQVNQ
ncbi:MAG: hypothetical protein P1U85_02245 [Verrucomicrobiales bacterium]|nr:hypothetical protein [Verrucomicrobiales bacterium]